jgi:hypothetical protein
MNDLFIPEGSEVTDLLRRERFHDSLVIDEERIALWSGEGGRLGLQAGMREGIEGWLHSGCSKGNSRHQWGMESETIHWAGECQHTESSSAWTLCSSLRTDEKEKS